jgi:hypothetical protein
MVKKMSIKVFIAPGDPTAYLVYDYDVSKALPYVKKLNE